MYPNPPLEKKVELKLQFVSLWLYAIGESLK